MAVPRLGQLSFAALEPNLPLTLGRRSRVLDQPGMPDAAVLFDRLKPAAVEVTTSALASGVQAVQRLAESYEALIRTRTTVNDEHGTSWTCIVLNVQPSARYVGAGAIASVGSGDHIVTATWSLLLVPKT